MARQPYQLRLSRHMSSQLSEIAKEKDIGKETVQECMWKEIHEMYQDWYNDIDKKIKKY